jgi:hypothetical protein
VSELMAALRPFAGIAGAPAANGPLKIDAVAIPAPPPQSTMVIVPTQRLSESIVSSAVTVARPQPQSPPRSGKVLLLAGIGTLVLLAAGGLAMLLGGGGHPSNTAMSSASPVATTAAATGTAIATQTAHLPPPADTPTAPSTPLPSVPSATPSVNATTPTNSQGKPPAEPLPDVSRKAPVIKAPVKPIKPAQPANDDPFNGNQK